jgi:hypothetical protein
MKIADMTLIAGGISSLIFVVGGMPMLYKAWCTRNLNSYSPLSLALSTAGNALYWLYVISLPLGPIWFLHAFWTLANGLMLLWYLRYRNARPRPRCVAGMETANS